MNFCPVPHTQRDLAWLGIGIFIGSSLYYFKKSKGEAKSGSEVQRQLSKQDPAGLSQRSAAADGKVYFSYSDVHSSICSLASRIKSEFKPDVIIAIGGGGFIPARMLRTEIKVPILAVSLELYDDSTNTARTTVVRKQWYDIDSELGKLVKGGRVLIVDEVDDTRATLEYCVKEVQKDGPSPCKTVCRRSSGISLIPERVSARTTPQNLSMKICGSSIIMPATRSRLSAGRLALVKRTCTEY